MHRFDHKHWIGSYTFGSKRRVFFVALLFEFLVGSRLVKSTGYVLAMGTLEVEQDYYYALKDIISNDCENIYSFLIWNFYMEVGFGCKFLQTWRDNL